MYNLLYCLFHFFFFFSLLFQLRPHSMQSRQENVRKASMRLDVLRSQIMQQSYYGWHLCLCT